MHKKILLILIISFNINSNNLMEPTSLSKDLYSEVILDGEYIETIDKPDKFLGFEYATRVATPEQITAAIQAWSQQSDRLKVIEYGRTHENRPLHAVVITSPRNLNNYDEI